MNDLKTLINEEYKDITFDMEASYIISLYEKERRKKAGVLVTTAVCLFMIMTVFIRMNPKTVETLMNSTGKFFSNLVSNNADKLSVSETTSPPQPNTSDNLINKIATSTSPDDKREYKKPNKGIIRPVAVKPTGVMEETRVNEYEEATEAATVYENATEAVTEKEYVTEEPTEKPTEAKPQATKAATFPTKVKPKTVKPTTTPINATETTEAVTVTEIETREEKETEIVTQKVTEPNPWPTSFTIAPTEKPTEADKKTETSKLKYLLLENGTVRITSCIPTGSKLVFPETIDGYTVSEIGEGILQGYNTITEIVIPDSVTTIGENAFKGLSKLSSFKMSENIKTIGSGAFYNCGALASIDLKNVEIIGASAFQGCNSITEITVPAAIQKVGSKAFSDCMGLKAANINADCDDKNDMTYDYTFSGCKNLETVNIGEGVTMVNSWQFYQCYALKDVSLPESLKYIYNSAFSCCTSLERIEIPEGVVRINKQAFYKNRALNEVKLPDSIEYIGVEAFYGCRNLLSITIPKNVEKLEEDCFGYTDVVRKKVTYTEAVSGFTIYGYDHTAGRSYAVNNGFKYVKIGDAIDENKSDPTTITLDGYIAVLSINDTFEIKYNVEYPNGETTFTTSDESIAVVDSNGKITAVGSGRAAITVTNNGVSKQFIVIVF